MNAVEARGVRLGIRTLVSLALCAAAGGAALAHFVIDIVGDYVLARDSYDNLRHSSRDVVSAAALVLAAILAARGLRVCCDLAARHRARLLRPVLGLPETLALFLGATVSSTAIVPGMEYLDGRLDGVAVDRLGDAFGGSILVGMITTLVCAGVVTLLVYAVARWLISYRDSIVTIIETLLRRRLNDDRRNARALDAGQLAPRRRRAPNALRLAKRGPPGLCSA